MGLSVNEIVPLSGGSVDQVFRIRLVDDTLIVAKLDDKTGAKLEIEAYMLRYLGSHSNLPVPSVIFSDQHMLLTTFVAGRSALGPSAQIHAAELLSELHNITSETYGFECDTLIGGLNQPNTQYASWIDFFRDQRLIHMAKECVNAGRLPIAMLDRIESFCSMLETLLDEPNQPSLLHGDAWVGNILADGDRITAFVDPAIYFGNPEIELAFTTLFGTFGQPFFGRYNEIRPIKSGFMESRKDIYNLYPLLVHVRLFGGSYVTSVEHTLERFGC